MTTFKHIHTYTYTYVHYSHLPTFTNIHIHKHKHSLTAEYYVFPRFSKFQSVFDTMGWHLLLSIVNFLQTSNIKVTQNANFTRLKFYTTGLFSSTDWNMLQSISASMMASPQWPRTYPNQKPWITGNIRYRYPSVYSLASYYFTAAL